MQPRPSSRTNQALTLIEILAIIGMLAVLAAMLLPALASARRKSPRIGCVNSLKEIGLACRVWEGDNGDKYPMKVSVTNGGSMELAATGNVLMTFLVMSNELSTPKILHCPDDTVNTGATSFGALKNSNISYFVGVDVTNDTYPHAILSGDDNFEIDGVPVKSGLLEPTGSGSISWSAMRHKYGGTLCLADGSVQQRTTSDLRQSLQQTGAATNRLAIP